MIDAVAPEFRRVDVLERELHAIIHLEAALRLADQAEIAVVHDDMDVGQIELRADRQLLDQELEIVVAGNRHDLAVRIGDARAERGGNRPAERARLAAVDPVARLEDVQELRGGDLRQADRRDVAASLPNALFISS